MKRDLKSLFAIAGKKMAHPRHELVEDFENVSEICSKHHVNLSSHSLKKLWELATGKRKLSKEAKDRLALLPVSRAGTTSTMRCMATSTPPSTTPTSPASNVSSYASTRSTPLDWH